MSESSERRLRFRIRRGNLEVELDGEFDYVKEKFEELMKTTTAQPQPPGMPGEPQPTVESRPLFAEGAELEGVLETTPEGRPHFAVPFDAITAKEAIGLMLYRAHPNPLNDRDLSDLLSSSWKTTKAHVVRARASELRKDGKLIAENGRYSLSGAGVQWIRDEVVPRLKEGKV